MNKDAEHPEPESPKDDTLARHKKMVEVLDGKRQMDWSDWTMNIEESKCLTPEGHRVALLAVETLRLTLQDDFFRRCTDWLARMGDRDPSLVLDLHPVFSFGFWPANVLPWVYANLIRWAACIQLFRIDNDRRSQFNLEQNKIGRVQRILYDNLEPINWVSAMLQIEIASLGLRAGWQVQFEPKHRTGKKSDVLLTHGSTQLLIETTTVGSRTKGSCLSA